MSKRIIDLLNNINKEFYSKVASHFDSTREYYWEGWNGILPFIDEVSNIKALDVGCGNGRFGLFLKDKLPNFLESNYYGIDFDEFLLKKAWEKLPSSSFKQVDVLDLNLKKTFADERFDLITLFGVLHHIPSYERRLNLLKSLKSLLAPQGKMVFSTWEFIKAPNFPKNTVSWESQEVSLKDLEENDYLLTWSKGVKAIRYCHYISPEEATKLCADVGLKILKSYTNNTKGDEYNRYFVTSV